MIKKFLQIKKQRIKARGQIPVQGKMNKSKVLLMNSSFLWMIISAALPINKQFRAPEYALRKPPRGRIFANTPALHLLVIFTPTTTTLTIIKMEITLNTNNNNI